MTPKTATENARFQVVICDRFDLNALARLKSSTELTVTGLDEGQLTTADGLIIRSRLKIDRSFLATQSRLKAIVTATSGFDHIDLAACRERGIAVMHTPNANAASASELTWALALACTRRLHEAHQAIAVGDWRRDRLIGGELRNKTWAVVGLGRIGRRVARIAQAFEMKTVAYDPYLDSFPDGVERLSLSECLKLADIVSFHVPKTKETLGMLSAQLFSEMNPQAILINTSRGQLYTERDLCHALHSGWLAAAGLDVFEREPLAADSPLIGLPNVILTPHLGATTREAFAAASEEAADKILAFALTGAVSDPLPPVNTPWFDPV